MIAHQSDHAFNKGLQDTNKSPIENDFWMIVRFKSITY